MPGSQEPVGHENAHGAHLAENIAVGDLRLPAASINALNQLQKLKGLGLELP
jgi:hypothetical protein